MDKKDKALEYLRNLEKLKASGVKGEDYTSPLDQDVMKIKAGPKEIVEPLRIKNTTEKIDTKGITKLSSGKDFMEKIAALRAGKKALSALPFAGATIAALQGDPAMAAEELAGDIPVAGQIYEAFKPEAAGNAEEDRQLRVEDRARKDYKDSPAYRDRRDISEEEELPEQIKQERKAGMFSKLGRMMGKK